MGDFHVIGDFQQTRVTVHVLSDGLHVRPSETKSSYSNPTNDATYHYVDPIPLLSFLFQRLIDTHKLDTHTRWEAPWFCSDVEDVSSNIWKSESNKNVWLFFLLLQRESNKIGTIG
ncbi:unnamed protein product [Lactuca saligna]|uniref:Uncharacterized protein n=1 Tax=Lactuca saligna TaxID=75948 RepID=A0AA35YA43_LACSI|nr:unnamed protein product [Lactuca saligna]